jgi:hypothetical protein
VRAQLAGLTPQQLWTEPNGAASIGFHVRHAAGALDGVRLALGASAASILRLVIREGGLLTELGATLGLAGAIAVTRALRSLLYGVTPLDGLTIVRRGRRRCSRGARRRRLAGLARGAHRPTTALRAQ